MSTTTIDLPKSKYELEFNQGSVYEQEERDAVLRVLAANAPSCGSEVLAFEKEFSNFVGATFGIAVGNATQGLELAVRAALSLSRNEVVVPAVSWISTASAAALAGAVVRFADVAAPSVCVDVEAVKRLCNEKTAAVIVVHLYGRPVDGVLELAEWLKSRHIALIEDCAHSVGATIRGRQTGSVGDIGVFSFHQQKNMVTLGEGGLVVTSSPELREKMVGFRSLNAKSYDPKGKYLALDATRFPMDHRFWMMDFGDYGSNFRMTDMQAAVGREQLKKLARFNARRRAIAHRLHSELSSVRSLRLPELDSDVIVHSWHVFHILLTAEFPLSKEEFMWSMLKDFGVKVWNHYAPMHLASCFRLRQIGKRGDCPNAEALFEQYVSLPIHPRLSDEAVAHMINAVKSLSLRPNQDVRPSLVDKLLELSETRASESHFDQASQFETFLRQNSSELFSSSSVIVTSRAPGRLDLMGGNGDYSGSMVIQCN